MTLGEVRVTLGRSRGPSGRFGGHSGKFETDRRTLGEIQDGSRDPRGGSGWVRGLSEMSGSGRGTHWEVWKTRGVVLGTLGKIRGTFEEVCGTPRRCGEPPRKSRTCRGTPGEVRDGSGDPRGDTRGQGTYKEVRDG